MNCLDFRRAVGADPNTQMPEVLAHAEGCAACRHHRDQLRQMDRLIYRALEVDPQSAHALSKRRGMLRWKVAASIVAACALGALLWVSTMRETLAKQLVAHVEGEPAALTGAATAVQPSRMNAVLARSAIHLKPGTEAVSYAVACSFRNHEMAHLVVRTDEGPYTVFLFTRQQVVRKRKVFDERGFHGVILPAPRGSIAVLGRDRHAEQVADRFLQSVEYLR